MDNKGYKIAMANISKLGDGGSHGRERLSDSLEFLAT